jgi:hypothetical protein
MFVGSINHKIRNLLWTERDIFQGRKVCVGCSGNFTIEQILYGMGCEIWSNDIALYSSLIGCHLTGNPLKIEIRDRNFEWLAPFMGDSIATFAAVAILFEMLRYEKRNNLQQIRLWNHYRERFGTFHIESCKRISETIEKIKIDRYTAVDVHDLYEKLPAEWIRMVYLPSYVGGYELLYKRLDEVIGWPAPQYELLTKERYEETLAFMKQGDCIYLSDYDREEEGLFAIVKTGRLRNVYLYSNMPFRAAYIRQAANFEASSFRYLPDNHEITRESRISFLATSNRKINFYRNVFLKKGIEFSDCTFPVLVFLDGFLFGFLIFDIVRYGPMAEMDLGCVYMLSDFVIASPVKRLSKLLLLTTKTKEMQEQLKRKFIQGVSSILTTAFTDKPVSMKYRGIYTLMKRGKGFLQYTAKCGEITLQDAVNTWLKKYRR